MIGRLKGQLISNNPPDLLLDINGVGYELQAPLSTIESLPELGETVILYTHFSVREDAQTLYGFYHEKERSLFRQLIKVSGVGPKMALGILSGMEVNAFIRAVGLAETEALVRLPGVGKKTAERLVIELRGKLLETPSHVIHINGAAPKTVRHVQDEAIHALLALGYSMAEANRAIQNTPQDGGSLEQILRLALQNLARVL